MSFRSRSSPWWENCAVLGHVCPYCDKAAARERRERLRLLDRLEYAMELREQLEKLSALDDTRRMNDKVFEILKEQMRLAEAALAWDDGATWAGVTRSTRADLRGVPEHLNKPEWMGWHGIRRDPQTR